MLNQVKKLLMAYGMIKKKQKKPNINFNCVEINNAHFLEMK